MANISDAASSELCWKHVLQPFQYQLPKNIALEWNNKEIKMFLQKLSNDPRDGTF